MPTLAELRAQTGPKPLPKATRTVTLIEGQHLLARQEELKEEHLDLLMQADRDAGQAERDGRKRTQKAGQKPEPSLPPRAEEIKTEIRAVGGKLAEFQSEVGLSGLEGGEWQRYKDAHPPREGSDADQQLADGKCNASALFADLGRFVVSWEGDELADGDWNGWLAERICYADRRDLVTAVVEMHETRLERVPKSPSSSSPTESSETD